MRKRVKPFDPAEVARLCPIVREVIVMEDEEIAKELQNGN